MATPFHRTPIAMLHHVSNRTDWASLHPFVISENQFSVFLDTIEASGRQGVSFRAAQESTGRNVIITFDDCGRHLLNWAVPELKRRGMTATFFFPTHHVGRHNDWDTKEGKPKVELMNQDDLNSLIAAGMEVGSHGHRHIPLGESATDIVKKELTESKGLLEEWTGSAIAQLAWPYGSVPHNADDISNACGFDNACAIFSKANSKGQLRRVIVHEQDTAWTLRLKFGGAYRAYRSWTDRRIP